MDGDTKPWWQSRGVWGGVVAALCGILGALGWITRDEAATLTDALPDLLTAAGGVAGGALAVWGRLRAEKRVR